jgi:hypothetical protein
MIILLLAGCGEQKSDSGEFNSEDISIASEIWEDIQGFENNWTEPDVWQGILPSVDGTHGAYVQIWADELAAEAINSDQPVPNGGTIVKCGFEDESGAALDSGGHALTAMRKIEGYDPDNQDWFWVKFNPENGDVDQFAGSVPMCSGCHSADPDGDYIRITE